MVTAKAVIRRKDLATIVPIVIPDLDEARKCAAKLHMANSPWKGEVFGWPVEYNPERPEPPIDSKMTFTPADFCIGESDVWFFSLMWEHGRDADPVEFLDDRSILPEAVTTIASAGHEIEGSCSPKS